MTAVEKLGPLRLRDKILTSFSVTEAKTSMIERQPRSMLSIFQDGPIKDNKFLDST